MEKTKSRDTDFERAFKKVMHAEKKPFKAIKNQILHQTHFDEDDWSKTGTRPVPRKKYTIMTQESGKTVGGKVEKHPVLLGNEENPNQSTGGRQASSKGGRKKEKYQLETW